MERAFFGVAALRYRNSYHHQTKIGDAICWLALAIIGVCIIVIIRLPEEKRKQYSIMVKLLAVMLFGVILFAFSYVLDALISFDMF